MKGILFVVLFFVSCTNVTSPVKNQQLVASKEALILTYSQRIVSHGFLRDSLQNIGGCQERRIDIDFCYPASRCDSLKMERMKEFIHNEMDTQPVVLFSNIGYNLDLFGYDDVGGGSYQFAISRFPFAYTATRYDGIDSTHLILDLIDGNLNVFLKIDDRPFTLNRGDSLVLIDTVFGGAPPVCLDTIIIEKKLNNEGMDSLPNDKYRLFF